MGSKVAMLSNGLGRAVTANARDAERVVDLFSGSGAISWFAAERLNKPVLSIDLQEYAAVFARAVTGRTRPLAAERIRAEWLALARKKRAVHRRSFTAARVSVPASARDVQAARRHCRERQGGIVWATFGGYYYSPHQALTLDLLRSTLPRQGPARSVCEAALLVAAIKCAAAPGHTAQPFSPTPRGLPFIVKAWSLDPIDAADAAVRSLAPRHARVRGRARAQDAIDAARRLRATDLVIVDPPYSAVQYSRFYHVLETIARDERYEPEGVGRYPPLVDRPRSEFSLVSGASHALDKLFDHLAAAGCKVLVTFPAGTCSNGLSGDAVAELAKSRFHLRRKEVPGRFSTMGGNNVHRPARHYTDELILTLTPR